MTQTVPAAGAVAPVSAADSAPPPYVAGAPTPQAPPGLSFAEGEGRADAGTAHQPPEISLTIGILVFGMAALGFLYMIGRLPTHSPFLLRIYTVTIIVFGTLAVVSSALAAEHIAPVVGLFGTIAGYIMGRADGPAAGSAAARGERGTT